MTKAKDDGRVEALISWNYNNLKCSRPLPPDASDEDYRKEFEKAIQLTEEAVRNLKSLTETQREFYELCDEYVFLVKTDEAIARRIAEGGDPSNEVETALRVRLKRMQQYCFEEHTSAWEWERRLYDALAEQCDDGNEPPF